MEKIKALILYKDWLLLNRGEIRPEVGDKIFVTSICESQLFYATHITLGDGFDIDDYPVEGNEIWFKCKTGTHYTTFDKCYVEIDYNPKPNLEGLLKDGYTFICTEHGLYSNCDCQDNQIKVWSDEKVDELKDDFRNITNIHFDSLSSKLAIEFAEWIAQYQYERDKDLLWRYWDVPQGEYTTEELFEVFKRDRERWKTSKLKTQ